MKTEEQAPNSPKGPRGKRRWAIVLVIVGFVAAALGIGWYKLAGEIRTSEPYKAVLKLVQDDPQVVQRLGQPIGDTWLPPSGSVLKENANFMFKVAGPKGKASVRGDARVIGGKWAIRGVDVIFADDGKRITLNTATAGGEGDAPIWKPKQPAKPKTEEPPPKLPPAATQGPDIQLDIPDAGAPGKPESKTPPTK